MSGAQSSQSHIGQSEVGQSDVGQSDVGQSQVGPSQAVSVDPDGHVMVSGDIDVVSAPLIEAALRQAEAHLDGASVAPAHQQAGALVIDVGRVGFIDSSGLRALLSASRRNAALDRRVVLRTPGNSLKRLLDITGTAMMFDLD